MKFIPTNWSDSSIFEDNLINLASNLFRIKFYYQEDQLEVLNLISNLEEKQIIVLEFQKISDEVTIYIKVVAAFINKNATVEKDMNHLQTAIDYFSYMENSLADNEIINNTRYKQWLKNHEYY